MNIPIEFNSILIQIRFFLIEHAILFFEFDLNSIWNGVKCGLSLDLIYRWIRFLIQTRKNPRSKVGPNNGKQQRRQHGEAVR